MHDGKSRLWVAAFILALAAAGVSAAAGPGRVEFELAKDAPLTSAGVYDAGGKLVRVLWSMQPRKAGKQVAEWDGKDESGADAPEGEYSFRVVVNGSTYRNVGVIGNTGQPAGEPQHIQHVVMSLAIDAKGKIHTANGWEEAGHDFKVMDPTGKTLFHARYQIRNGNPNGAPHAIAVDDAYIYCATHGWASEQWKSRQQIQRFHIADGNHEKFTDPALAASAGHIQLYEWPEKQAPEGTAAVDAELMSKPVRALAVRGEVIFAADCLGNKVHKFHKVTGAKLGEFPVKFPHAMAIDAAGRLWIGHEHSKVSVFDADGKEQGIRLEKLGDIRSLSFAPDGRLVIADGESCQVRLYDIDGAKVKPARAFGQKAKPGDYAADRFYSLRSAAVDPQGNLVTIDSVTGGGARIAKFSPDGKCLWEQLALMFCDVGGYSASNPDEIITQRFHRIQLTDRAAGKWEYRGTVLAGDPKYLWGNHGVPRHITFGQDQFIYQCYGDGMQIYRKTGDLYRLAAMVGGNEPLPDGRFNHDLPDKQRKPVGLWSWADQNGDGKVDEAEVVWFQQPGKARYALFGMNAARDGTLIWCEHHTHGIWELPMAGRSPEGNPIYDWRLARQVVAKDESPEKFDPLMAVRADDGSLYAMGRSGKWPAPGGKEAGYIWMGGWALARYDRDNRRQWIAKLPEVCPGLCDIPGGKGGAMLGYYKLGHVYHYEPGGLLIGTAKLGDPAGNQTGWMDNTAALAVNRDPRDGVLDVFGEDSWLNRMIWYRVDDRDVRVIEGKVRR